MSSTGVEIETAVPVFDAEPLTDVDLSAVMVGDKGARGKAGITADQQTAKVDACARFIVDHLHSIGMDVSVRWGALLDACGLAGFAGSCNPENGRWSNPNLMGRAVERFNDVDHKPEDLAMYRIVKETDDPYGEGKAKAFHLECLLPTP